MAEAETNQVLLQVSEESQWGEDPSTPSMAKCRFTGGIPIHNKDTVESATIRSDRMTDDIAPVMAHSEGEVSMELSYGIDASDATKEFGLFAEGALGEDFVQVDNSYTVDTSAAGKTYTDSGATFITDGFAVGMHVKWSGFTQSDSNGVKTITGLTETVMTVAETIGTDESSVSATGVTNSLRNGIVKKSYLMQQEYQDLTTTFTYFTGLRVNRMEINCAAGQIATVRFSFMGKTGVTSTTDLDSSADDPLTYSVMNATSNVGTVLEGGSALAAIRSFSLTIDNSARNLPAVASPYAIGVNYGRQRVTGTIEAYFQDNTLLDKYINHTETSIELPFSDAAGNTIIISVPSMYYTSGSPTVSGGDDEVTQTLNFGARREQTNQLYQVQIDMLPA